MTHAPERTKPRKPRLCASIPPNTWRLNFASGRKVITQEAVPPVNGERCGRTRLTPKPKSTCQFSTRNPYVRTWLQAGTNVHRDPQPRGRRAGQDANDARIGSIRKRSCSTGGNGLNSSCALNAISHGGRSFPVSLLRLGAIDQCCVWKCAGIPKLRVGHGNAKWEGLTLQSSALIHTHPRPSLIVHPLSPTSSGRHLTRYAAAHSRA